MLKTTADLRQELQQYKNPDAKIQRMVTNGELFLVKKGLYETDPHVSPYVLANHLYGPSYISFDYALCYYDLIPEWAFMVTSATCGKRKTKRFYTSNFGSFRYQDIPSSIFFYGVQDMIAEGRPVRMASPEKAICDRLYLFSPPVSSQKEMLYILFCDLRMEEEDIVNLSMPDLRYLSEHYPSRSVHLFYPTVKRYLL